MPTTSGGPPPSYSIRMLLNAFSGWRGAASEWNQFPASRKESSVGSFANRRAVFGAGHPPSGRALVRFLNVVCHSANIQLNSAAAATACFGRLGSPTGCCLETSSATYVDRWCALCDQGGQPRLARRNSLIERMSASSASSRLNPSAIELAAGCMRR